MLLYKKQSIFSLLFFLITGMCFSQTQDTVFITADFTSVSIGPQSYSRTGENFLPFPEKTAAWKKINEDGNWLSPGQSHWIFTSLKNTDTVDHTMTLYFNNVQAGLIKRYLQTGNLMDSSKITGSLVAMNQRATTDRLLSIPFTIRAGKSMSMYIKTFRKVIGITLTPVLYKLPDAPPRWPDTILTIALTLIFIIMLAALFVLWVQPSKEIAWFFVYIFFGFLYTISATGFGSLHIWSSLPRFEENSAVFLGAVSTSALIFFSCNALKLYPSNKWFYYYAEFSAFVYALAGTSGYLFYAGYYDVEKYGIILTVPYLLILSTFAAFIFVSVYKAIKMVKVFWWFSAIFISFFMMAIFLTLLELGLIKFDYLLHPLILAFGTIPQMILALIYLLHKTISLLKERALQIETERTAGLQELLSERLRISNELHDEVGATLSGISMYSHLTKEQIKNAQTGDVEKSLNIIQQSAGDMVNKLSDIVWLTNPGQDSLHQLLQRLEEYLIEMGAAKNIKVQTNFAENIGVINLSPESRRNIYLIFKEAINNAIKYSNASLLQFEAKKNDDSIEISLKDNGVGFDIDSIKKGNGLNNMQQRAKDSGNQLNITSKKESGTNISVSIKITQ